MMLPQSLVFLIAQPVINSVKGGQAQGHAANDPYFSNGSFFNAGNSRNSLNRCFQGCPPDWDLFKERCYLWVDNQTKTWFDAEDFCQTQGGHLVSIETKEVNEYLLRQVGVLEVWIGATDWNKEGTWEWSDSSPFIFTDWAPGQPTGQRIENCAQLYNTDQYQQGWNDLHCGSLLNFVCSTSICPGIRMNHHVTLIQF